ncbi:hypothetical protein LTR17_013915 [Elasticomyces elasticus]|nr:hypothetical protein LTR17_013915 [Elasticomyces elasticus]
MAAQRKGRKTVIQHKKAAASTEPQATMTGTGFLDLPPELREQIYDIAFSDVTEVKVMYRERRTPGGKILMEGIWLADLHKLSMTCRQIFQESHDNLFNRALRSTSIRFVIKVLDFDFRHVYKFLEHATAAKNSARYASLFTEPMPRLVIDFYFTNAHSLDAKKLGKWLRFRNTPSNTPVTFNMSYLGDQPGETMAAMSSLECAFLGLSNDILVLGTIMRRCYNHHLGEQLS